MSGLNNKQKEQSSACSCACSNLLVELIKQNNQLIQINNEQNAQINELLIQLTEDDDKPKRLGYLDGD